MSYSGLPSIPSPDMPLSTSTSAEPPTLRIDVGSRRIIAANAAAAALVACRSDDLIGRPLADYWVPEERDAVMRRFDDVILFGHSVFHAVALPRDTLSPIRVGVDARYLYQGGQRLEVSLVPESSPPPVPARDPAVDPAVDDTRAAWPVPPRAAAGVGGAPAAADAPAEAMPPTAAAPAELGLTIDALQAAGVAALRLDYQGRVIASTPAAGRLVGNVLAAGHDMPIEKRLRLPGAARQALETARREGARQSVLVTCEGSPSDVVLEWLPAVPVEDGGVAVLLPNLDEDERADRLRVQSQIVSQVSHDVRDLLAAVYCGLRTIADALPPDDALQATIEQTLTESQRANRMVGDALAMARPGNLVGVELDLDTVVHETLARFGARAAARGVELIERLESGCRVKADLSGLERALGNLIENALDALPQSGQVRVATAVADRGVPGVEITVADTGMGIKPETRPNIFEPYFTDKDGGTGLGLAITRRVVLDHGGQIHFESQEGRGTTFLVWLPRLSQARA